MSILERNDPEIFRIIRQELNRQRDKIELIASENFTSKAVMEAQGSILTNKYAEGYPGKRYYGGCEYVDQIEEVARERVKTLFKADHANVQPHSGTQANFAVYFAFLKPGDKALGMNLAHGGHLTHGSAVNISGKYFDFIPYGVDPQTGLINYDEVRELALQNQPKLIVTGASAYPRTIDFGRFRDIADEVGAILMVDMAHIAGLVAAGLHPNPVEYAQIVTSTTHKTLRGPRGGFILCSKEYAKDIDKAVFPGIQGGPLMHVIAAKAVAFKEAQSEQFLEYQRNVLKNARILASKLQEFDFDLVSGGTDTHLMLVDLRAKNISGKEAEIRLDRIGITANKNAIPFDPAPPAVTSGLRLGTPAVTTRGFGEKEMEEIAEIINSALKDEELDKETEKKLSQKIKNLSQRFPLYV